MKYGAILLAVISASGINAAVQDSTLHPEEALLVSEMVSEYLGRESMVSFREVDGSLVLFAALGGEWTGSPQQWDELLVLSSYAAALSAQKPWSIVDIAVSYGEHWLRVPVEGLTVLEDGELDEDEMREEFRSLVQSYSMNDAPQI
ncbi:MAG: hypothetical protein GF388_11420 [Candidatus Aegiribacteria sp.]|nr:hypothetical protein [Candidatus Aegiribacteria sp.]MBD3295602.1 hypothetical protein [Candidatus Fermentibacteria bacterium]